MSAPRSGGPGSVLQPGLFFIIIMYLWFVVYFYKKLTAALGNHQQFFLHGGYVDYHHVAKSQIHVVKMKIYSNENHLKYSSYIKWIHTKCFLEL